MLKTLHGIEENANLRLIDLPFTQLTGEPGNSECTAQAINKIQYTGIPTKHILNFLKRSYSKLKELKNEDGSWPSPY